MYPILKPQTHHTRWTLQQYVLYPIPQGPQTHHTRWTLQQYVSHTAGPSDPPHKVDITTVCIPYRSSSPTTQSGHYNRMYPIPQGPQTHHTKWTLQQYVSHTTAPDSPHKVDTTTVCIPYHKALRPTTQGGHYNSMYHIPQGPDRPDTTTVCIPSLRAGSSFPVRK